MADVVIKNGKVEVAGPDDKFIFGQTASSAAIRVSDVGKVVSIPFTPATEPTWEDTRQRMAKLGASLAREHQRLWKEACEQFPPERHAASNTLASRTRTEATEPVSIISKPGHSEGPLVLPDGCVVWRHGYTIEGDGAYPMPNDFHASACARAALPPNLTPGWMEQVLGVQFPRCWARCSTSHLPYLLLGVRAVKVVTYLTDQDIKGDGLPNERGYSRFFGAVQREMGSYAGYVLRRADYTVYQETLNPDVEGAEGTSYQAAKLAARIFVFPPGTSQADVETITQEQERELNAPTSEAATGTGGDASFPLVPFGGIGGRVHIVGGASGEVVKPSPMPGAYYRIDDGQGKVVNWPDYFRWLPGPDPVIPAGAVSADDIVVLTAQGKSAVDKLRQHLVAQYTAYGKSIQVPKEMLDDRYIGYMSDTVESTETEEPGETTELLSACLALLQRYRNRCQNLLEMGLSGLPRTDEVDELIERVRRAVGEDE